MRPGGRRPAAWVLASAVAVGMTILLVAVLAGPARATVTAAQVEAARQELRAVNERLQGEVAHYDAAQQEESELRDRIERIRVDLAAQERRLELARTAARLRVAQMYMDAGSNNDQVLLGATGSEGPARLAYLNSVGLTDRDVVNRLEQARRDYVREQELLQEALDRQQQVSADLEQLVNGIYAELDAANARYQAVKQEWDRQEAERIRREEEERLRQLWLSTSTTTVPGAPPGTTTVTTQPSSTPTTTLPPAPAGTMVCPVDGATTFRDSWGEPRPGGRTHTGVDMMAAMGTPLVAIENGVIYHPNYDSAGGIGLYIKGDSGDTWYYAHMSGYAPGIVAGLRVAAGQLIGYVGQTGNAASPHLHFAHILPSGRYINPYPVALALCG
jgi:murein DD-endopeptidase MepM/ murein hydrolase activator NlpD